MTSRLDAFVRRPVFWAVLAMVGLLVAWWLAWMAPESAKLTSARDQKLNDQAMIATLEAKMAQLHTVARHEAKARRFIAAFEQEIPSAPNAPALVVQIYRLAARNGLRLESITDNAVNPGATYSSIPVSLQVTGSQAGITAFVGGLYRLPRLLTIQQVQLSGPANGDVLAGGGSGAYQATISATAYTTSVTASSTAGTGSATG
jgi:type IV pilus assembly protein PilO